MKYANAAASKKPIELSLICEQHLTAAAAGTCRICSSVLEVSPPFHLLQLDASSARKLISAQLEWNII